MDRSFNPLASTKVSEAEWEIVKTENEQLHAKVALLETQLETAQTRLSQLEIENKKLKADLKELKQVPFQPRRQRKSPSSDSSSETASSPKKRGRPKGHAGSSRPKPDQVDYSEFVTAGDSCPDCQHSFTGTGVERERTVEDIEPVRPTVVTRYIIERRWCPHCLAYKPEFGIRKFWHIVLKSSESPKLLHRSS